MRSIEIFMYVEWHQMVAARRNGKFSTSASKTASDKRLAIVIDLFCGY